jgi:hypothetical protein
MIKSLDLGNVRELGDNSSMKLWWKSLYGQVIQSRNCSCSPPTFKNLITRNYEYDNNIIIT